MSTANDIENPAGRLDSVQLLRAMAVAGVVLSHVVHELNHLVEGRFRQFNERVLHGDFGVDLFFVISGFVMVYVTFAAAGSAADAWSFVRKRIIRIVPLYWIMTTVMILVVVLLPNRVYTASSDWHVWLASYFFVPYARDGDGLVRPVLGLGWTLQYEMYFYALFAIGLLFPYRRRVAVVAGLVAAGLALGHLIGPEGAIGEFLRHGIVLEFVMGMGLCLAYGAGWRMSHRASLLVTLAAFALLAALPSFPAHDELLRFINFGIPGALLVAAAVLSERSGDKTVFPMVAGIGDASYATYLTHPFVIGFLALLLGRSGLVDDLPPVVFVALYVAIVVPAIFIVGHVTHHHIDRPVTAWIKTLWPARPRTRAVSGSAGLPATSENL